MKSNSLSNDKILDAVYDLADVCGMRIGDFIAHLQEEYGDPEFATEGLPEEVIGELENARQLRKESREAKRKEASDNERREEIKAFRERFPEVRADQIPSEVWEEVANGMDLSHAYAFWMLSQNEGDGYARSVNEENALRSAAASGEGDIEPSFSKEEVERMSAKDVAKNYKNILRSFGKWKY